MWNKRPYLAGSMIGLKKGGSGWRRQLSKWFDNRRMKPYDPCTAEASIARLYGVKSIASWDWDKLPQEMQEDIVRKDLNQIRNGTNFVVCFFTKYSTGTVSELTWAFYHSVPVYIVTKRRLRGWPRTVGKTKGNEIFKNFDSLKRFLVYKYKLRARK